MRGGAVEAVAEAVVAVDDHGLALLRNVVRQPGHEPVHGLDLLGLRGDVLLAPAPDLTLVVIAGLAEVAEAHRFRVDVVQRRQHPSQIQVHGPPLFRRLLRQAGLGEHPAVDPFHHVELGADDLGVVAAHEHLRYGYVRVLQRFHHPMLAVHLMG